MHLGIEVFHPCAAAQGNNRNNGCCKGHYIINIHIGHALMVCLPSGAKPQYWGGVNTWGTGMTWNQGSVEKDVSRSLSASATLNYDMKPSCNASRRKERYSTTDTDTFQG